jgi:signal transduction histidine kinase/ActR/RegA family two-component response regulator
MIPSALTPQEERVLIFAPFGSDGAIAQRVLDELEIPAHVCDSMLSLCEELQQGVGAVLITEEALWDPELDCLIDVFDSQPSWSAIPIVIAANIDQDLYKREHLLRRLEDYKVTFLSRPVVIVSLASMLRSALAARRRQYQVRGLMLNLHTELRLRDEFLATLSHELRNPLSAVRNAVQLMNMAHIADPRLAKSRDIIDRQSMDLSRLLDDLLDVARVTQGKISLQTEEFSLHQLLGEIVRDQREAGSMHCEIVLQLPADPLPVKGDRLRIKQVFLNLLHNADKFSDGDGEIRVRARTEGNDIAVSVRDRGIGIPRHMLDSVFHLFSQAARTNRDTRGGLGIGLTVVQGLVQMHQGRVTVSSAGAGKGAEFTVYLPRFQRQGKIGDDALRPAARPRGTGRPQDVLLVEDDPDGGASLKALLELDRHRVTVCHDGRSGLMRAREMKPDVIILDIALPDSSGYEIARLLRSDPSFSHTLIIALTGYGSAEDRRRAKEAGFDHHLTKPIEFPELRSLLSRGVPRNGGERSRARADVGKASSSG